MLSPKDDVGSNFSNKLWLPDSKFGAASSFSAPDQCVLQGLPCITPTLGWAVTGGLTDTMDQASR